MTVKNMAYDHAAYIARSMYSFGQNAAGAGSATQFAKFVAFTTLQVLSLTATLATAGTSTSTLWNGTATVTNINGDSLSLIRIYNTASAGAAPALATATFGPFAVSLYNGTATGTQTNAAGVSVNVPLFAPATIVNGTLSSTSTGVVQNGTNSGLGGFPVNQGDQLYILRGTDATAITAVALEYGVLPFANVTA